MIALRSVLLVVVAVSKSAAQTLIIKFQKCWNLQNKTLFSVFFYACFLHAGLAEAASQLSCALSGSSETVVVKRVLDGDTLILADDSRVRLIGLNTPELAREGRAAEPLALAAKTYLKSLAGAGTSLRLQRGHEARDHYGRDLAHLFLPDGRSVEQALLAAGMGFHIAIPPNLDYLDCLRSAENSARDSKRGVWSDRYFLPLGAAQLSHDMQGFRRVQGIVSSLEKTKAAWWLELEGDLVLRIKKSELVNFDRHLLERLPGQEIVVRGWLINRHARKSQKKGQYKPWIMSLKHPLAIVGWPD